jgi:hypothetical protein
MKAPNSELIYRQLLAAGVAVDAALAIVAVLKAAREGEEEGHWVTIEGRRVFIRGPAPPKVKLLPIEEGDSINYDNLIKNGEALDNVIMKPSRELRKIMRRLDRIAQEIEDLRRQRDEVQREYSDFMYYAPKGHPLVEEKKQQYEEQMKSFNDRFYQLYKEREQAEKELFRQGGEFVASLKAALGESTGSPRITVNPMDDRKAVDSAIDWISRVIGRPSEEECVIAKGPTSRSFFMGAAKAIILAEGAGELSVIHEYGHFIESQRPTVQHACVEFLRRRYERSRQPGSRELRTLNELSGTSFFEEGEVAFKDDFRNPYVGKVYKHGRTEVFSMGLEYLADNPLRFRKEDPEHYYLTLGLIAYLRKNPIDRLKQPPPYEKMEPWASMLRGLAANR